ncbi:MAG: hypothetical protein KAR31_05755 [Candidatus Omnitrophica bacterium]|nr:hypothetical protein [Candidatus Omnitrophota bacterium]
MPRKKTPKEIVPLLKGAINTFTSHPVILVPFVTIAFIQIFVLEILYFSPRFPLSGFFNPIVWTFWGEGFVHYPNNFTILPKLFQYAQIPLYIFISSFLIAVAMAIIAAINDGRKVRFLSACRSTLPKYIHVFIAASMLFGVFYGFHRGYSLMMARATQIASTEGVFFIIKTVVIKGAPYFNLLIGVFVTTVFAFVFPLITIDGKKIFSAIGLNFKHLWGSFWFVSFLVVIPTAFYLPILLLRSNVNMIAQTAFPEVRVLILLASILVTMFIDATVYTAITTYYLLKKERS